jgi:RNA polymerase sigma-70 factor (ECF subfamily)
LRKIERMVWKIGEGDRSSEVDEIAACEDRRAGDGASSTIRPDTGAAETVPASAARAHPVDPASSAALRSTRELLIEHVPVLCEVARGLCRDPVKVEDLVQDVLEKALRSIDVIELRRNPRGWLVTILHNLHIDRCRQQARRGPHVPWEDVVLAVPEPSEEPAWSRITAADVRRAAAGLPGELRAAYVMFAFEQRPYAEIAAALGSPRSPSVRASCAPGGS